MTAALHYDYTTVGHVSLDLLEDGTRRAGGTALYAALQAARLGLRTLVITQGSPAEIEDLMAPFTGELDLRVIAAPETTTLSTVGVGAARRQRLQAWAGPMPDDLALDTEILHLAPIAREIPARWRGTPRLVGLTPQGLLRRWAARGAAVELTESSEERPRLAHPCDALVLSEHERPGCSALIEATVAGGGVVAVTDGPAPTTLLLGSGGSLTVEAPPVAHPLDDLGAGDVFAAAFFAMLAEGLDAEPAARFAAAAASLRLLAIGPGAIADRTAIAARLAAA